jgi:hypothetical protein
MDEADLVRRYCVIKELRYLNHERYISGWDESRRDNLVIAVEDYSGRYEVRVEYEKVEREVAADQF